MIKYITQCKRCRCEIEPVREDIGNIDGTPIGVCPECMSMLAEEKKDRQKEKLFTVPGQDKPYQI